MNWLTLADSRGFQRSFSCEIDHKSSCWFRPGVSKRGSWGNKNRHISTLFNILYWKCNLKDWRMKTRKLGAFVEKELHFKGHDNSVRKTTARISLIAFETMLQKQFRTCKFYNHSYYKLRFSTSYFHKNFPPTLSLSLRSIETKIKAVFCMALMKCRFLKLWL